MTESTAKRLFLAVLVVILPLGFQSAMGHETTTIRTYVTWFGLRITPYKTLDTDLSLWIKDTVGHRPDIEEWTQTTLGLWWFPGKIGTAPGNWLYVRGEHPRYLAAASDDQRQQILDFVRRIVQARTSREKSEVSR